jgi:hypothetical protein
MRGGHIGKTIRSVQGREKEKGTEASEEAGGKKAEAHENI